MYKLYNDDCLKVMDNLIEEGIKVDCIITDPPYGTTRCKWDSILPIDEMWERVDKLIKENGAIILFGIEPFSSMLRVSNIKRYRYDWIWDKGRGSDFLNSNRKPLSSHENISIFYSKKPKYNPQFWDSTPYKTKATTYSDFYMDNFETKETVSNGKRYPLTILKNFKMVLNKKKVHPSQKPVDLLEYLIKTYTDEGDLILDFTMGSGSTGCAAKNLNRDFIGIELDKNYFNIAKERIENI